MPGPMVNDVASETKSNKPIPANIEAEKSVLAACILNGDILEEILLKIERRGFPLYVVELKNGLICT